MWAVVESERELSCELFSTPPDTNRGLALRQTTGFQALEIRLHVATRSGSCFFSTDRLCDARWWGQRCILTPNVNEYRRLTKAVGDEEASGDEDASQATTPPAPGEPVSAELRRLCARLGGVTIVAKGAVDQICNGGEGVVVGGSGSCRRAGGQGDVLAGTRHTITTPQCNMSLFSSCCIAMLV